MWGFAHTFTFSKTWAAVNENAETHVDYKAEIGELSEEELERTSRVTREEFHIFRDYRQYMVCRIIQSFSLSPYVCPLSKLRYPTSVKVKYKQASHHETL